MTNSTIKDLLPTPAAVEAVFDQLWPICRSITGSGLRQSYDILKKIIPLNTVEVPSGTKVFNWTIPNEWNISEAYIEDSNGHRIVDFAENNLHVVSYSVPVDKWLSLDELNLKLHSLPDQPEAIPYKTSYYNQDWGFCIQHKKKASLRAGTYHVVIRSTLAPGHLTYGHCVLPSTCNSEEEILISSYLCHPSLANNELSGPLVTAFLYNSLQKIKTRRYNYRFIIVPETIGSIAYLSQHGTHLSKNCKAGLVVTCVGDNKNITYKRSRRGNSLIDRCTINALESYKNETGKTYQVHDFFPTGSDERQYCSPGFNLPVGSLMRSMYATYPEYHTSLDNKSFISFDGLVESIELYLRVLTSIENNYFYTSNIPYCEPMLSAHNLYPSMGGSKSVHTHVQNMMYLFNYSDGQHDLCDIAHKAGCSINELAAIASDLESKELLRKQLI